jgi:hypothetical protein
MALSKPNIGTVAQINQSSNKRFIWYFLVVSFLCALPAFILYAGYDNVQILFIFFQIITLIIASFHIYFINEKLRSLPPHHFETSSVMILKTSCGDLSTSIVAVKFLLSIQLKFNYCGFPFPSLIKLNKLFVTCPSQPFSQAS